MYPHVLYEFASVFWVPALGSDPELRESVYLRVMISIRNIAYFLTFRENGRPFEEDVFAWQFFDRGAGGRNLGERQMRLRSPRKISRKLVDRLPTSRLADVRLKAKKSGGK